MPFLRLSLCLMAAALLSCGPEVGDVYEDGLTGQRVVVDGVGPCSDIDFNVTFGALKEASDAALEEVEFQRQTGRRNYALLNAPSKFDTIPDLGPGDTRNDCVAVTLAEGGGGLYGAELFSKRFSPAD